jgi:hypothetical protein
MANRRFEMFEYRQVLVRMRLGDSERAPAKAGLIGRPKAKALRQLAESRGWLDVDQPLPDDAALSLALRQSPGRAAAQSSVEPYRERVSEWIKQGIQAKAIHQALLRRHGYRSSYSSVYPFVCSLKPHLPKATMHLELPLARRRISILVPARNWSIRAPVKSSRPTSS